MHYLIDAYNLLFRIRKQIPNLEECRKLLIEQINAAAEHLHLNITLVFDGAESHISYPLRAHFDAIALVYTPEDQTADEYIVQEVASAPHPETITVVSNDRALIHACRLHKAHNLTIDAFFSLLVKKEKQHKSKSPASRISYTSSSEFKRLLALFEQRLKEEEQK